jgi:hypothetical protein
VAAPCERQSAELVRKCERFLRTLGIRPRGDGDNRVSILLDNGSRVVGLPGNETNIRGFLGVSLLLINEAARVPDELYLALRPKVATVGDSSIWLMSTPNGRQGFFCREWTAGDRDWSRIAVPAAECPRILREFLDEERRTHTEASFRQEYECESLCR